jgi:threonine dehydratase
MITAADIETAYSRIRPFIRETPTIEIDGGAFDLASPIWLKLETLQHTGSFKPRGAFNALLSRPPNSAGVVAVSGGNHGAAVAYGATRFGLPARVFVPSFVPSYKIDRMRSFGASVVVIETLDGAFAAADDHSKRTGATFVHPYDQVEVIQGQGTIGLELERQVPGIDTVLVSVGGGGLIGGVASWFAGRVRVVAVESQGTATLATALRDGPDAEIVPTGIAASALGAARIGKIGYAVAKRFVDLTVTVSDLDIVATQRLMWNSTRLFAEPGGAAALAALTSRGYHPKDGERVAVLLSGGNADPSWFSADASPH